MRPRVLARRQTLAMLTLVAILVSGALLCAGSAVLHPRVNSPSRVDAIVVVAGAHDDRYSYARRLAQDEGSDTILVSRPERLNSRFATLIDGFCASPAPKRETGEPVPIECFAPRSATTEGEAQTATRIARDRGYDSLLVVTYWGHVSRVRMYFEQCFDGTVLVTDTPRPASISRRHALLHESGGYAKALLKPAC